MQKYLTTKYGINFFWYTALFKTLFLRLLHDSMVLVLIFDFPFVWPIVIEFKAYVKVRAAQTKTI